MQRIGRGKVFWLRFTENIGYMRLGSVKACHGLLEFLRDDTEKHNSAYRVFHTRRLVVIWEREGKAA